MNAPKWKAMVERTTILRCDVGSHGWGLSQAHSDYDEKGVCVEDLSAYCRVEGVFEQHGEKIEKTDTYPGMDLEIFSLRKFVRLALHGNPTIVALLFSKRCSILDERGQALQALVPYLISKSWGKRFLGYMEAQRQRIVGERGQKRVNRPELVERFGFDTKYAMHMLRLGFQGVEVMETGQMTLPMSETHKDFLMGVREGKVSLTDCMTRANALEIRLRELLHESKLPDEPDRDYVEVWTRSIYWESWKRDAGRELLLDSKELFDKPTIH